MNIDVSRLSVFGRMYVETMRRTSFESQKRMEPREIKIRKATYVYKAGRYISLLVGKCVRNVSYNQELRVAGPLWSNQISRFPGRAVPRKSRQEFSVKENNLLLHTHIHNIQGGRKENTHHARSRILNSAL